uniref:Myosin motor domain-containing protein n=1 Tax=Alexandrium monilatum TaxID=311494 RepID=A0A7S4T5L7_9DINO
MPAGVEVGAKVWVPCHNEVWRPGEVVGFGEVPKGAGGGLSAVVEVQGEGDKVEKVEVALQVSKGPAKVHLRNQDLEERLIAAAFGDLNQLPLLHEPAVLHTLQVRFEERHVYTLSGPVLLAVNPFREVPGLYSHEQLAAYALAPEGEEPQTPHVFGVGCAAYQGIRTRAAHQTVLVSGESGAGKTETTKFVMRFLALAGAGGTEASMSAVERQVLGSIPVLEALGNAKTLRNDNSSRFGKYIELQFGRGPAGQPAAPRLVGARTHTYLLEKVRVTGQQQGERSFHIFYQALAAAEAGQSREDPSESGVGLGSVKGLRPADFAYLRRSAACAGGDHEDAQAFRETVAALRSFGVDGAELSGLLSAIMAVLHLGNVDFAAPKNNSEGSEPVRTGRAGSSLECACELLQVEPSALGGAWCHKTMRAPGEGVISTPLTVAKAVEGRDALARHLYGAIFTFVVERINAAVAADGAPGGARPGASGQSAPQLPFVGVLDIFGFEFFDRNSLEQLLINYTNELLQQYFNEVIFELEAELYGREGIKWNPLDFPDNRTIVELIGKVPGGVLPMLDEECMTVGGSADRWCSKLQRAHDGQKEFAAVKHRQGNFVVRHFAGPVEYTSQGFPEKNRDQLGADLVGCMKGSRSEFVCQRFLEHDRIFGTQETVNAQSGNRRMSRARVYTVSSEFRGQLQNLMERIRATEPHFVRCIKPNPQSVPGKFDRRSVVQQLQYQGVLQAIEVSRAGFPMRLSHRKGVRDFRCIAPAECRLELEAQIARGKFGVAAQVLFGALAGAFDLPGGAWAIGATLVFLKRDAIEVLSGALTSCCRSAAILLQAHWHRHVARQRFLVAIRAAVRLQAFGRGLEARRLAVVLRRARAALRLQSAERARGARRLRRRRLRAVSVLQVWLRVRKLRRRFLRLRACAARVQRWWRLTAARLRARRRRHTVVRLQCAWRGHRGRRQATECRAAAVRLSMVVRRLVRLRRERVCRQLLAPVEPPAASDGDYSWPQPERAPAEVSAAPSDGHLQQRVEAASTGDIIAAIAAVKLRLAAQQKEVAALRQKNELLQLQADELHQWTLAGMSRRLLAGVLGGPCAEGAGTMLLAGECVDD